MSKRKHNNYRSGNPNRKRTLKDDIFIPIGDAAIDETTGWLIRNTRKGVRWVLDTGLDKVKYLIEIRGEKKIKALGDQELHPEPKKKKNRKRKGNR